MEDIDRQVWTACTEIVQNNKSPTNQRVYSWLVEHRKMDDKYTRQEIEASIQQWHISLCRQKSLGQNLPYSVRVSLLDIWNSAVDQVEANHLVESYDKVAELERDNGKLRTMVDFLESEVQEKERARSLLEIDLQMLKQIEKGVEDREALLGDISNRMHLLRRKLADVENENNTLRTKLHKLQNIYLLDLSSAFESINPAK